MGRKRAKGKRISPLTALADLNVALSETVEYKAARQAILTRFARLDGTGKPMLCEPPIEEQRFGRIPGAFKVIYNTERNAIDSARELFLTGSPPQTPYGCERGEHFHLRTPYKFCHEKTRSTG